MHAAIEFPRQEFAINLRTLAAPQSGVQRYARELDRQLAGHFLRLAPAKLAQGIGGHIWEQFRLPFLCGRRLLFSPGNTGPWLVRNQVVTIHDASTFDCADAFAGPFGRWYRWLLPKLARRAAGVITVSNFSRDRLAVTLGIAPAKIAVVYNGVTAPPAAPTADMLRTTRQRLDLPNRFLLFVGSHDPRKNVSRLLAEFAKLNAPELHLVLAGGSNAQLFNTEGTQIPLPRVRALGHVSEADLESLYALAEGFVFPSLYEGFGLPPLEAMARGCPVLCSNATCLPEVCGPSLEDGGACLYFTPHDSGSILSALQKFVSLPREAKGRMAEAGRRHAERYSWECCARETFRALHRFCAAKPHANLRSQIPSEAAPKLLEGTEANPG